MPRFSLLLLILWLPLVVGCEGCRNNQDQDAEKKEEVPLEDFTASSTSAFPSGLNPVAGGVKPGHWLTASLPLKSNKIDVRGELQSTAVISAENFESGSKQSVAGPIQTTRPIVLPKGQLRRFDYRLLAPVPPTSDEKKCFLSSRFVSVGRASFYDAGQQPFNVLAGNEFFFVVLTNRPERFAKFQVADWVEPPRDEYRFQNIESNYRIVIPPVDDLLPLAETMLDWTATAVLFWDDLSADALTPAQHIAIADWVHFGGQLIVNGAGGSEAIAETALADLLPLKPTGNIELDPSAAEQLLQGQSVPGDPSTEKQITFVKDQTARLAIDGITRDDTSTVADCGNLVLERRVGRGRVVQPRFDVTSDWLLNWKSYDSFVNGVLLRRPPRRYVKANQDSPIQQIYPDHASALADATFNTQFRIATRDAILNEAAVPVESGAPATSAQTTQSALVSRHDELVRISSSSGVGGWTDDSDLLLASRQILRDESGIEIPESSLVVRSLGYYLLILVPINYLIFRMLGRLEYAWLAVPLIAIVGALWVARAARLDIGFARSQTQLGLVEMQPEYPRGHLSRVIAIYNSLSRSYDVEFNTTDAVAVPIENPTDASGDAIFKTGFAEGPILTGLAVGSNQVRMLHTEQMIDMGGTIELTADGRLVNGTSHSLLDAFVIEKSPSGEVSISSLGPCASGSTVKLRRKSIDAISVSSDLPMQTDQLLHQLAAPRNMHNGTSRLVARIDAALSGMTISPEANQRVAQTILLAHLKHPSIPAAKVDENLIGEFVEALSEEDEADDTATETND